MLWCMLAAAGLLLCHAHSSTMPSDPCADITPFQVWQFACAVDGAVYGAMCRLIGKASVVVAVNNTAAENLYPARYRLRELFFDMIVGHNTTGFKGFLHPGKTCGCPNDCGPDIPGGGGVCWNGSCLCPQSWSGRDCLTSTTFKMPELDGEFPPIAQSVLPFSQYRHRRCVRGESVSFVVGIFGMALTRALIVALCSTCRLWR